MHTPVSHEVIPRGRAQGTPQLPQFSRSRSADSQPSVALPLQSKVPSTSHGVLPASPPASRPASGPASGIGASMPESTGVVHELPASPAG
jgi:hypothetical protein